jgi:reactive intermediate/imine deaminase
MTKRIVYTTQLAPQAIGTYSQAVRVGDSVYLSGQIPLDPKTMTLVTGSIDVQIRRVFDNLQAVANVAGGQLDDIVKLTVYLTNLDDFPIINEMMAEYFHEPYPARAVVGVAALPKGATVEMDAIMIMTR